MGDAVFAAEFHHGGRARHAQFRFQRSRFIVNARMDHAAVMAALMLANTVFFFQQQQAKPRKSLRDFETYCEPDDSPAYNDDAVA